MQTKVKPSLVRTVGSLEDAWMRGSPYLKADGEPIPFECQACPNTGPFQVDTEEQFLDAIEDVAWGVALDRHYDELLEPAPPRWLWWLIGLEIGVVLAALAWRFR